MNKKLFKLGLAPLAVITAFVVMPAMAQAAPHWYVNGALLKEGKVVEAVTWGEEKNLAQISEKGGEINCKGIDNEEIENPVGGGAGVDRVQADDFYQCKAPQCEAVAEKETGQKGKAVALVSNLPWNSTLEENPESATGLSDKVGEPFVAFGKPTPGMIVANIICSVPALGELVLANALFEGELTPEAGGALNGTSASKPSKTRFAGATTGALHSELAGLGVNTGLVKIMGYNGQETITVKNP